MFQMHTLCLPLSVFCRKVSLQISGESGEILQKKDGVSPAHLSMVGHVQRADVRINLKGPSADGFCCFVITC